VPAVCWHAILFDFEGETMTVPSTPARKTPWLAIILGVLAVLCLCAVVISIAILAYLTPIQASAVPTTVTEVFTAQETALPTIGSSQEA
jgi:hypothetical protein